jgi:hypothetical protein
MALDHIAETMTMITIVAFDIIVTFGNPVAALLTLSPVMWRKEHLWNISVLQRVPATFQSLLHIRILLVTK